jgi:hypothetical protein
MSALQWWQWWLMVHRTKCRHKGGMLRLFDDNFGFARLACFHLLQKYYQWGD